MNEKALRHLPSIDQLLRRESLREKIDEDGRETVRDRLREVVEELRDEILSGMIADETVANQEKMALEIARRMDERSAGARRIRLQKVINATGVILHTNLGRAPLSPAAIEAIRQIAGGYSNLEFDLATGERGHRGTGLEEMLREMFGCEAVAVVNNCAAAVLLTLNTLAEGGEVIVSRGELIEIGGSFRIPDVIAKSGARIREVGTTNRTRLSDYENAINENTRVILRAHPSNYRIVGFTEKPSIEELARLAEAHHLPFFEDLGSGCLLDLEGLGIHDEPTVVESLEAGVPVLAFSGDKLLGGPQAGIILGRGSIIERIKKNPLMRALRVDKLTFAALEATIEQYRNGSARLANPVAVALQTTRDEISERASRFVDRAQTGLTLTLVDGDSVIGGGCAPEAKLPTRLISVSSDRLGPAELESRLRNHHPPIIARIEENRLLLDLRTVRPDEEETILAALTSAHSSYRER
ncbi:MAG: L-seryl-tRNA(Sec) selenium transferase [Acidobacteriota bacterium]|nr:MAG: L-seryl-tRNA(Sec) selenium transferase [Acidobacteriota bacterium]